MNILTFIIFLSIILIGIIFILSIKKNNYELNCKDSILFIIGIFILTIKLYFNFDILVINLDLNLFLYFTYILYSFIIIYYIVRLIKLKKIIPFKNIAYYLFLIFLYIFIYFEMIETINFLIFNVILLFIVYVILLLIINTLYLIISILMKRNIKCYFNKNYKISIACYINVVLIILFAFFVKYTNVYIHKIKLEENKKILYKYLYEQYPNDEFELIKVTEEGGCDIFNCFEPVFKNEVKEKRNNKSYYISIRKKDMVVSSDTYLND